MGSEEAELVVIEQEEVSLGTLHAGSAGALVAAASDMAKHLADVIEQQSLYVEIQRRRYVRVEGWTTLAVMLGCTPREVANVALEDGSYLATVEIVRMRDGAVISRASSECGMDEPVWAGRARYARRSMAATRATGKACRLAFSWIMALAGYEATPAEEMPHEAHPVPAPAAAPKRGGFGPRQGPPLAGAPTPPPPPATWLRETTGLGAQSKTTFQIAGKPKSIRDVTWDELSAGSHGGHRHKWLADTLAWCQEQDDPGAKLKLFMERAPLAIEVIENRGIEGRVIEDRAKDIPF